MCDSGDRMTTLYQMLGVGMARSGHFPTGHCDVLHSGNAHKNYVPNIR